MRKILTLGCALALCTSALFADEPKKPADDMQKAQMEAWMKASTPGDAHKKLDGMVGSWNVTVKSWMQPGAPPMESTGSAVNAWVLGGRWMEEKFTGNSKSTWRRGMWMSNVWFSTHAVETWKKYPAHTDTKAKVAAFFRRGLEA